MRFYFAFLLTTLAMAVAFANVIPDNGPVSLYDSSDKVKLLNYANFESEVSNKNHSTLVEFFSSYCGHCRRFAPFYKQLAEMLYDWRDIVPVTAIDCAREENNGICRKYGVMFVPNIRYFGPNFQPSADNYGTLIESQDLSVIINTLIERVAFERKTSNMPSWPDFQAAQSSSASSLLEGLDSRKEYVVFVYDPQNAALGPEMILHFLKYPNVAVKIIVDAQLAARYELDGNNYKIALIDRQGFKERIPSQPGFSFAYKQAIVTQLNLQAVTEKPESTSPTSSKIPDQVRLMAIMEEVKRNKHFVYQADLRMAIRSILHNEIPKTPFISGERLLALQRFLAVLERYNPLAASGRLLISQMAAFVAQQKQELSGEDFENELKKWEQQLGPITGATHFVGCIASQGGLRGYTCSLWQLFHFMTVRAATLDRSQDPLEVLSAIHGYVKHFFGCTECSRHFQVMAFRREFWSTSTKDEAVITLWAAHNEVNQRLAGDNTEDPQFPKIQFPSSTSCPECYKQPENTWDTTSVLQFLKHIHNPDNISRYGLDSAEL